MALKERRPWKEGISLKDYAACWLSARTPWTGTAGPETIPARSRQSQRQNIECIFDVPGFLAGGARVG
jgi:hypothetical protein